MGLPIWKPKNEHSQQQQRQQQLASPPKSQYTSSPSPHPIHAHYRLYRRSSISRPANAPSYYLAAPDHQTMLHPLTTEQLEHDHHFPPLRSHTAEERHHNNDNRQFEQRLVEKQELLDQLNITVSLLDQFLSMRDLTGQGNVDLPPFITDDLLAILTATSATLTTNNNMGLERPYDRVPPSSRSSIDTPYAAATLRLADLESSIVLAHHRVSDRLNLLGASIPVPSTRTR